MSFLHRLRADQSSYSGDHGAHDANDAERIAYATLRNLAVWGFKNCRGRTPTGFGRSLWGCAGAADPNRHDDELLGSVVDLFLLAKAVFNGVLKVSFQMSPPNISFFTLHGSAAIASGLTESSRTTVSIQLIHQHHKLYSLSQHYKHRAHNHSLSRTAILCSCFRQ